MGRRKLRWPRFDPEAALLFLELWKEGLLLRLHPSLPGWLQAMRSRRSYAVGNWRKMLASINGLLHDETEDWLLKWLNGRVELPTENLILEARQQAYRDRRGFTQGEKPPARKKRLPREDLPLFEGREE